MPDSTSTFLAFILGLGVFAIIGAIGWRSVQHRRILRLQGADGQETIIVAGEDDEISSVATTTAEVTHEAPAAASPVAVANTGAVDTASVPAFGRKTVE